MGRAFEYRKAAKLKRWGHMAKTFTRLGKQIAIAVKQGGPEPENNPSLRSIIAVCKRENMPKDNIERAIKNAMGKDQSDFKSVTYEGYGPPDFILEMIDFGVEDEYDEEYDEDKDETTITIYGEPTSYNEIQKKLEADGYEDVGGEFTYIPNDLKDVDDEARATINKMVEKLEEFDDVQTVYTNMKPAEE